MLSSFYAVNLIFNINIIFLLFLPLSTDEYLTNLNAEKALNTRLNSEIANRSTDEKKKDEIIDTLKQQVSVKLTYINIL